MAQSSNRLATTSPDLGANGRSLTEQNESGGPPPVIEGKVISGATGIPLAQMTVIATIEVRHTSGPNRRQRKRSTPVGEALTDAKGQFVIEYGDTLEVQQDLSLLRNEEWASLVFRIRNAAGESPFPLIRLSRANGPILLGIEWQYTTPTTEQWNTLVGWLREARLHRLDQIVKALAGPLPEPLQTAGWSVIDSQNIILALEYAYLDPEGLLSQVQSPPSFYQSRQLGHRQTYREVIEAEADTDGPLLRHLDVLENRQSRWLGLHELALTLDLDRLAEGELKVVNGLLPTMALLPSAGGGSLGDSSVDNSGQTGGSVSDLFAEAERNEHFRYRNYLRRLFTIPADADNRNENSELTQALKRRFKQDFWTLGTELKPTNEILVDILKRILTAPRGAEYGFGLSADSLPEQGDKSTRTHLDELITLSGQGPDNLGKRYRLDLSLPDTHQSSEVQLNIYTLQAFYRDGYQSGPDPHPIIPANKLGKAPFFLYFEEWQKLNAPFYAENHFPLKESFRVGMRADRRAAAAKVAKVQRQISDSGLPKKIDNSWFVQLMAAEEELQKGNDYFRKGQYHLARNSFLEAGRIGQVALRNSAYSITAFDLERELKFAKWNGFLNDLAEQLQEKLWTIKSSPVGNEAELKELLSLLRVQAYIGVAGQQDKFGEYYVKYFADYQVSLLRLCLLIVPACLGEVEAKLGNYAQAIDHFKWTTRFLLAKAFITDSPQYNQQTHYNPTTDVPTGGLYDHGNLPYSANTSKEARKWFVNGYRNDLWSLYSTKPIYDALIHPVEKRFFNIRHANAMLEWADELYRTNNKANKERARELYKAVMFIHNDQPDISPSWLDLIGGLQYFSIGSSHARNPVVLAQVRRAAKGIYQLDQGLNFFGVTDEYIPVLRYDALKQIADRVAKSASQVQQQIISALQAIENSYESDMVNTALLEKAVIQAKIAEEQRQVALFHVSEAQEQVKAIHQQLEQKRKELEEAYDGFEIIKELIGGVIEEVKNFSSIEKTVSKGASSAGATAGMAAAAGAFAAGGYVLIKASYEVGKRQAERQSNLRREILHLQYDVLPRAREQVKTAKRMVTIANYERQIAQIDARLAQDLLQFERGRFLNRDFWAEVLELTNRVLRRYLDLGARFAWQAERALAYSIGRQISIIRQDYYPDHLQGITGAMLLQSDLEELETARLAEIKSMKPLVLEYSLLQDFPLQYLQLKSTGRCQFRTDDLILQKTFPGTYGHRILNVSPTVITHLGPGQLQGMLYHNGVSASRNSEGEQRSFFNSYDGQPISDFNLENDRSLFGLPDEALYSFEGSGIDTEWTIELPPAGNSVHLRELADVRLRFNLRSYFSPQLRIQQLATAANEPDIDDQVLSVSLSKEHPTELAKFAADGNTLTFQYDLSGLNFIGTPAELEIANVSVHFISDQNINGNLQLTAGEAAPIVVTIENDFALSNAWPMPEEGAPNLPPEPLNALIGTTLDTVLSMRLDKADYPGVDFSMIDDVVLGIQYRKVEI